MAASGCIFHRTLARSRPGRNQTPSSSHAVCRELLYVVELQRYSRDQGSSVYFPQAVLIGDDLYDVTLTDGDCRLRVTMDPGLNRLVERNVLKSGSKLCNATFTCAMAAQLPECPGASADRDSYRLLSLEVKMDDDDDVSRCDVESLPWFGSSEPSAPLVPLRAHRNVFLPLWNKVDHYGEVWRETPPIEEEEDDEEVEGRRPAATVSELRDSFLSGHRGFASGTVPYELIVRIVNKSHLMYYGRLDRNCDCPYKAVLEVCDHTGSVCVVLWNSVCFSWYCCLKPGDIVSLRRYRVKRHYQAQKPEDIEISVNSRNPTAQITLLPESSASLDYLPSAPTYSFYTSKELLQCPPGNVFDVIGLLTFRGRGERIRNKDGRGPELLEYHWLRLEDGASEQPIMVKLFSTSQPECHRHLHPLSVVVCTRLKSTTAAEGGVYLTNTAYTQVYCTGLGHHSEMSYRKLSPVQNFLQWLKGQDDGHVLSRAVIGGFFLYPPPPISLETYMKDRRGEPGFMRGAELQKHMERLCYRERRTFCIQAIVTMVTYSHRRKEDRCLFWLDHASSLSPSSPSPLTPSLLSLSPLSTTPSSSRPHPSPSYSSSLTSAVSQMSPRPLDWRVRPSLKRKLIQSETPRKRRPSATFQPEESRKTVVLFDASMEFLQNTNSSDDDDDDEDASSFVTAPFHPDFPPIANETLPMRYDHTHREEQADAVAIGGRAIAMRKFEAVHEDYYTLRLRALSDGVLVDAVFLPHSTTSPPVKHHSNTWTAILSHGAFSSDTLPPSPADLIGMAAQLANQRMVCVLEACHLGGVLTEMVLSRAFHLSN